LPDWRESGQAKDDRDEANPAGGDDGIDAREAAEVDRPADLLELFVVDESESDRDDVGDVET
jgi:hypothetical protein